MTSELEQAIRTFRRQYARQDAIAVGYMQSVHERMALDIRGEIERLAAALEGVDPRSVGEARALLYRKGLLTERLDQIDRIALGYAPLMARAVDDASAAALHVGARHGLGMLQSVVDVQFNMVPFDVLREQAAALVRGAPLDRLMQSWSKESAQSVSEQLMAGIAKGDNPRQIAMDMVKALDGPLEEGPLAKSLHRANVIARTETIRSYRSASIETYKANPDVVDGWIWNSAADERTCPVCWAMHGEKFDSGEPFDTHPQCRCAPSPSVPGYDTDLPAGEELFDNLPDMEQLAILGPARFDLYKRGEMRLTDVVGRSHHPVWGGGRFERSIKDMERLKERRVS